MNDGLGVSVSTKTRVTALLPAYQAAGFVQNTLDSLSAQTRDNFDVIISVDLCNDDTYAICEAHCRHDSRFKLFRQEKNLGYVGNCNFLLEQANGDYVLFAFHDDLLAPSYVDKLCQILDTRPEVIMTYSDVLLTEVSGDTRYWNYNEMDGVHSRVQRGLNMLWQIGYWWVPNRGIFRLNEARRIRGLKKHAAGEFSADLPWLLHMSLLGEFARVPETLCYKFYKPDSISRNWRRTQYQYYALYIACIRELWSTDLSVREKMRLTLPFIPRIVKLKMKSLIEQVQD